MFCDAGCHLNRRGKKRLHEYIASLQPADKDIVVFEQCLEERVWTKGDTLAHFGIIVGGVIIGFSSSCKY